MRILKQTEEYLTNSEQEAISLIETYRKDAADKGYVPGANGYTYKTKKAKGEIIDSYELVKATLVFNNEKEPDCTVSIDFNVQAGAFPSVG